MATRNKHLNQMAEEEHDPVEYRKRVSMNVDGTSVSYEDTNFVTGDSPAVLNVQTDLGRLGHDGYIINDGSGNFTVEFSYNGTTYGGLHTIKAAEILELSNLTISKIRLTWVTNSSYRVFCV